MDWGGGVHSCVCVCGRGWSGGSVPGRRAWPEGSMLDFESPNKEQDVFGIWGAVKGVSSGDRLRVGSGK